jgi:hypothetical protein
MLEPALVARLHEILDAALEEAKRAGKDRTVGFRGPYHTDGAWLRRLGSR